MQKTVSAQAARQRLGELLEGVYYRGDEVIIERAGKPMGVVVPLARYETMRAGRERLWAALQEARQGASEPSEGSEQEVEHFVNAEIAAYRAERRQDGTVQEVRAGTRA